MITIDNGVQQYNITNVLDISGLSMPALNTPSSSGYLQDGISFGKSTLTERYVNIQFDIIRPTAEDVNREINTLGKIFGKGDFTLRITSGGVTRYLSPCRLSQWSGRDRHGPKIATLTLQIVAGDPYFKQDFPLFTLVDELPNLIFKDDRFVVENDEFCPGFLQNSVTVVNNGDLETPLRAVFTGGGINPYLLNKTTGERLQIIGALNATDTVQIDTGYGRKRVDIVDESGKAVSAFNLLSDDSTFFALPPGENVLQYGFDNMTTAAAVEISIFERYYGHEY